MSNEKRTKLVVDGRTIFDEQLEEGTSQTVKYKLHGKPRQRKLKAGDDIRISTKGAPYGAWSGKPKR
jgi:hypothetical protein